MLKILAISIFFISAIYAKMTVISSIAPIEGIVKNIGGDYIDSKVMVPQGASPHTYEPKPSQMKDISKAKVYFAIGVEFENIWLKKFRDLNRDMEIIKLDDGIKKYPMLSYHKSGELDPHIWTSIDNLKIIATKITKTLQNIDSKHSKYYQDRLNSYISYLDNLKKRISHILSKNKNRAFMVFHPSWGYFAREFNLKMLSIEIEGKEPTPRELISLIKEAKKSNVSAIVTQPEFSDKKAKLLAKEVGVKVIAISPLSQNIGDNLLKLAKAISGESIE